MSRAGWLTRRFPGLTTPYALMILWRDRRRFLPALLAISLSAVLIAVQCGLVLGLVRTTSAPIDYCRAHIWVLPLEAPSLHQTSSFPLRWQARLDLQPEIIRSESFQTGMGRWRAAGHGRTELCMLVGLRLDEGSLGALDVMTPEVKAALAEPGTVMVDRWEFDTLGLTGEPYELSEVNGHPVRLAATLSGFQGFSFVYVFCSQDTMRQLVPMVSQFPDVATCLVARCRDPGDVDKVVARLRRDYPDMGVYSRQELSQKVRYYWLFRSRGGMVLLCTLTLALLVGMAVTSETLYAAVLAQSKEFAVLEALGIARRYEVGMVLAQAFWLGIGGVALALPITVVLAWAALWVHTQVVLSPMVLFITFALTQSMAVVAGLSSLRPLRTIEPATLLR